MSYAIVKDSRVFTGCDKVHLILGTRKFTFDVEVGELFFSGNKDTISYSTNELTDDEIVRHMANRAIKLMQGWGWTLYKSI